MTVHITINRLKKKVISIYKKSESLPNRYCIRGVKQSRGITPTRGWLFL